MHRNFLNLEHYLNRLLGDDYGQSPDAGHTAMIRDVFHKWIVNVKPLHSVLDVGCGAVCIAEPFFTKLGVAYTGITLGKDYVVAKGKGKNVYVMDMTFMDFLDDTFEMIWCRHTLEHSPMPLLTLMEFYRVARNWLCLILPNPEYYGRSGQNHYSVLYDDQWEFLMARAGWRPVWKDFSNTTEYRYLAEKVR